MTLKRASRWLGVLLGTTLILTVPAAADACPMCYTQAASAGQHMIRALRSGITVLAVPPLAICLGIAVLSYRKRNSFVEEHGSDEC